jgi:hypothetical protein
MVQVYTEVHHNDKELWSNRLSWDTARHEKYISMFITEEAALG